MLDYNFPSYSPGSREAIDFLEADCEHPAFDAPDGQRCLEAEARRTAEAIRAAAPGRIQRGGQTPEEAARLEAIFTAIAADLAAERVHRAACRAHFQGGGAPDAMPLLAAQGDDGFSWEDKLHALRREIHFRRKYDADHVAKGRLTAAAAREQLERLEAIQHKYWWDMFRWTSPTGAACGSPEWFAEVRAHTSILRLPGEAPANDQAGQEVEAAE